eukprot:TRINITY_DN39811_c0_g1_i4.p1 TRINITY_DN39811_c0_g1~~TRINITY_DN39811_c0_g1_i4.p1  ORF type:complete len:368 (+),score=80.05 TRINITY_DN39811_c0_g1_i4:73-1176(+)
MPWDRKGGHAVASSWWQINSGSSGGGGHQGRAGHDDQDDRVKWSAYWRERNRREEAETKLDASNTERKFEGEHEKRSMMDSFRNKINTSVGSAIAPIKSAAGVTNTAQSAAHEQAPKKDTNFDDSDDQKSQAPSWLARVDSKPLRLIRKSIRRTPVTPLHRSSSLRRTRSPRPRSCRRRSRTMKFPVRRHSPIQEQKKKKKKNKKKKTVKSAKKTKKMEKTGKKISRSSSSTSSQRPDEKKTEKALKKQNTTHKKSEFVTPKESKHAVDSENSDIATDEVILTKELPKKKGRPPKPAASPSTPRAKNTGRGRGRGKAKAKSRGSPARASRATSTRRSSTATSSTSPVPRKTPAPRKPEVGTDKADKC